MYIYHPRGVFLAVYDCLKEKFYTLILRFVYITFCLLTEPQTMLQLKIVIFIITIIIIIITIIIIIIIIVIIIIIIIKILQHQGTLQKVKLSL